MTESIIYRLQTLILLCVLSPALGQQPDSLKKAFEDTKIGQGIVETVTRNPDEDTLFTLKSEEIFLPYQGKVIREIRIEPLGFERAFYNGDAEIVNTMVKVGNSLHTDTKEGVIRDNLFVSENDSLNPYKLADNERYLRDLEFLLDARFEIYPVEGTDSVDLVVVTRDVFSLGGSFSPRNTTHLVFGVYDANFLGQGQRLEYRGEIDEGRDPVFGHALLYRKSSLFGSLVNVSLGFSALNSGASYGAENEKAFFFRLDRPLASPYTRLAGGLEWSTNRSVNVYQKPDSMFLQYRYDLNEFWIAYNIGINNNFSDRSRHVVALRWFHQNFKEKPQQEFVLQDPLYNDNSFVLSELTFFKENFYKTRYIYGFGRTEDVPYGHRIQVTTGLTRQLGLDRYYASGSVTREVVDPGGNFLEATAGAGTFFRNGNAEDATLLLSLSVFSRLREINRKYHFRQRLQVSYTTILNRNINPLLRIGNEYGVNDFNADSVLSDQRLGITAATVLFTNWKLLGFRFAPLAFVDMAFLPPPDRFLLYDKPYLGIGAGVRTRNENLIFGTMEFKVTFFPRIVGNMSHFNFNFSTNLRVKYTGDFVTAPSFLRANPQ